MRNVKSFSTAISMRSSAVTPDSFSHGTSSTSRSGRGTRRRADIGSAPGTIFGQSYVKRTFQRAGSVDKRTKFVLNEAHAERDDEDGAGCAGPAAAGRRAEEAGVRLDAVGLQGHLQPRYPHDPARFHDSFMRSPNEASTSTSPSSMSGTTRFPTISRRATPWSPIRRSGS